MRKPFQPSEKSRKERRAAEEKAKATKLQVAKLVVAGNRMRKSRMRSAPEKYLRKVYRVFWQWEREGEAKLRAWSAAQRARVSYRPDAHPLKMLIDATSGLKDRKDRSRYGRALQAATLKQVDPDDLHLFFRANGGIAGCAHLFASLTDGSDVL
jgi:hypothetical protein